MPHRCPWWIGYLLASPVRKLWQDPGSILAPYVAEGMVVLEPGPGMGFFTLELARLVGPRGRVVAVDVQARMLLGLRRRAARRGLLERIETREVRGDDLPVADLAGQVDFCLAFAMVHEVPDAPLFFAGVARVLKGGARLLLAEPAGHVSAERFDETLGVAARAGFGVEGHPAIRSSHTALLVRG
jgi:SAM-dependent methyltransferase